jgi:archaellum component FlaC
MLFGNAMARTLRDHEQLCEQRYENIERRLGSVEDKIDGIQHEINGFKTFIVKLAVKSFVGIVGVLAAAIWAIKL